MLIGRGSALDPWGEVNSGAPFNGSNLVALDSNSVGWQQAMSVQQTFHGAYNTSIAMSNAVSHFAAVPGARAPVGVASKDSRKACLISEEIIG
jgi:hypothetical protein